MPNSSLVPYSCGRSLRKCCKIPVLSFAAALASPLGMKRTFRLICLALGMLIAANAVVKANETVQIFAAASLRGGLDAALAEWPGTTSVSYGGSGAIARQVAQGAPADLVVLANPDWDAWLSSRAPGITHDPALLGNGLVLVGTEGSLAFGSSPDLTTLSRFLGDRRLAMGQHRAVPAGQYAREWLEHIGAWDPLKAKLAEAENVRSALAFVARGEAPLGIVYASDAAAEPRVAVLWKIPPDAHSTIQYPARAFSDKGAKVLQYLQTQTVQRIFETHGFLPGAKAKP